jgi:mannose/fructose/N-acetylgalactosamine-specific phosphotransferase system component IIC
MAKGNVMIRVDDPSEKRWTIMAALLGTNMAFALFQGLAHQNDPRQIRHIALLIVIAALPFQAVYFMIHAFVLEYSDRIQENAMKVIVRLATACQMISYFSIIGIAMMFYAIHWSIGLAFTLSGMAAIIMVRLAFAQADILAEDS